MIVLSPHLDDAVLSVWHVLDAGADVVNVFTGEPIDPETLSIWDKVCGATSSVEVARARVAEDAVALARFGIEPVNLGFRDATVRRAEPRAAWRVTPLPAFLAGAIEDAIRKLHAGLPGVPEVAAPLGGGPRAHPDHVLVRDAALILHRLGRIHLSIYADQPYVYKGRRWPTWATNGDDSDPFPDPWWHRFPRALPDMVSIDHGRRVRTLDAEERDRKLHAMVAYESQFENLNERLRTKGLLRDPDLYGVEVVWTLDRREGRIAV